MAYRGIICDYPLIRYFDDLYIILKHLSYYIYNIYTRMRASMCARTYIRIQYKYELSNCFVSAEALTIKRLTELAVQSKTRLYVHQEFAEMRPKGKPPNICAFCAKMLNRCVEVSYLTWFCAIWL